MNLGLAFYVKWFTTAVDVDCHKIPVGCRTELMEDAKTGADLGKSEAFSWHHEVPVERTVSFTKALKEGSYDESGGGQYCWDEKENIFWSWDTPEAIERKIKLVLDKRPIGGVFAWGLGEDAPKFEHL